MKTLVIHPEDVTTDFLIPIYENKNYNVIRNTNVSREYIIDSIVEHDRIIMLGHGTPFGLLGSDEWMIDDSLGELLSEKETICIWCNADKYVHEHGLDGLHTGMIISEMSEAKMFNVKCNEHELDVSNRLFAKSIKEYLENGIYRILEIYKGTSEVIEYNRSRIYY